MDNSDIPNFLRISPEDRRRAWERNPPKPLPAFGREKTEAEIAYYASIKAEKSARRSRDEVRFKIMRAKTAAEKAERQRIKQAIEERDR